MARYVVNITAGGRATSLLVVLSPSQPCLALVDAVKARLASVASKLDFPASDSFAITLHLDNVDVPILDPEDLISDVLPDTKEACYAVIEVSQRIAILAYSVQSTTASLDVYIRPLYPMLWWFSGDLYAILNGLTDSFPGPRERSVTVVHPLTPHQ